MAERKASCFLQGEYYPYSIEDRSYFIHLNACDTRDCYIRAFARARLKVRQIGEVAVDNNSAQTFLAKLNTCERIHL